MDWIIYGSVLLVTICKEERNRIKKLGGVGGMTLMVLFDVTFVTTVLISLLSTASVYFLQEKYLSGCNIVDELRHAFVRAEEGMHGNARCWTSFVEISERINENIDTARQHLSFNL